MRRKLGRDGKRLHGGVPLLQRHQGHAEQEVPARIAVLKTGGPQRMIHSRFRLIQMQRTAGQPNVRQRVLRVHLQRGAAGLLAVLPKVQLQQRLDPQTEILQAARLLLGHDVEMLQRQRGLLALDGDVRPDHVRARVLAERLQTSRHRALRFIEQTKPELAAGQHLRVVEPFRVAVINVLQHRQRLLVAAGVHAGAGHVPGVLAVRFLSGFAGIIRDLVDVAEIHELLKQCLVVRLRELGTLRRAGLRAALPSRDRFHLRRFLEGLTQHSAFHVLAHGQAEIGQDGWRHVQQTRAVDQRVLLESGPHRGEDALRPVPHGDARRHSRREGGPQVVAVEAVIAHQHDGGVRSSKLHQPRQQQIVKAVGAVHHILVEREVRIRRPLHLRRVEGHELVADLVNRSVIDRREVPVRPVLHQPAGRGVHAAGLRKTLRQMPEPLVLRLVNARRIRHEQTQHLIRVDVPRTHAQRVEMLCQLLRPVGARRRLRPVLRRVLLLVLEAVVEVRDDAALRQPLPLRGEPAHHMGLQPVLAQHLPHRLATTRRGRDRHHLARLIHLREARHAVMIRMLPGGDARPKHRRELRVQRGQRAGGALFQQALQGRHLPGIHQRLDDLPVRAVPTDEEEFGFGAL